jgi:NACHT domain
LSGPAGSGKSTITQTFAKQSAEKERLGGSFFCSRDFQDRRNIRLIFPTLAFQLALYSPEFRAALIPILRDNPDVCNDSPAQQFDILIVRPLQVAKIRTTVVIDALDKCEDNMGQPAWAILSVLGHYIDSTHSVKFFITGRPEPPIRSGFRLPSLRPQTEVFLLHDVDRTSVDGDIELYLRTRLSRIAAERSHRDLTIPWPEDKDIQITIKKCSGLFIVAYVISEFVSSLDDDPDEQLKIITSDPDSTVIEGSSGVDGTYDNILIQASKAIGENKPEAYVNLRLVVGSIVVVFNPLSCESLAAILGMQVDKGIHRHLHIIIISLFPPDLLLSSIMLFAANYFPSDLLVSLSLCLYNSPSHSIPIRYNTVTYASGTTPSRSKLYRTLQVSRRDIYRLRTTSYSSGHWVPCIQHCPVFSLVLVLAMAKAKNENLKHRLHAFHSISSYMVVVLVSICKSSQTNE